MADHDRFDLDLDRFWDDLVDESQADPGSLDGEIAAFVRRMQALAAVQVPISARDRVRSRLNLTSNDSLHSKEFSMITALDVFQTDAISANGRYRSNPPRLGGRIRAIPPGYQRLMITISLALGVLIVAFMFDSVWPQSSDPVGPDSIPAAVALATPSPVDSAVIDGLFDVDGHKLYIHCTGTGSPTLVFLTGLDQPITTFGDIPAAFSGYNRVCVYDRAGVGKSPKMPMHTASDSVSDLHGLLEAAKVPGPYLLVGAKFGGLVATMYAGTYPDDVAGMVLIGPEHPWVQEIETLIPSNDRIEITDRNRSNVEEVSFYLSLDQDLAVLPKVGDIPVAVLVGDNIAIPAEWPVERMTARIYEEYQHLADSFAQGTMIKLHSSAYILVDAPDQVITEIQKVLDAIPAT